MKNRFGKLGFICLVLIVKELAEAIKSQHSSLEVKADIKVAQEIEANDSVYPIFFRNGVAKDFDIFRFGISHAEGFESDFRNKMALRRIAEAGKFSCCFQGVTNVP